MKFLIVVVFLRLHFGLCDDDERTRPECLAGTTWESNCHKCRCDYGGMAHCLKTIGCDSSLEPSRCKPRTSFKQDCNTCTCVDNGMVLCTMMYCGNVPATEKANIQHGQQCEPGTIWKNDCNECECSDIGYAICSIDKCDPEQVYPQCKPNTSWKYECNWCYCDEKGASSCSLVECHKDSEEEKSTVIENVEVPEVIEPKAKSSPSSSSSQQKNKTVVCVANRMFVKDCNTCWCNEDGTSYFCTRKVCVPDYPEETEEQGPEDLRILKRQCRPDEVFELDCNTCRCNPDGKSFSCTRRACLNLDTTTSGNDKIDVKTRETRDTSAKELPKACQPGQEFRMDCNKCLCDNEGQDFSCTRIDCAAQNNNNGGSRKKRGVAQQAVQHCEPGSVFDVDCNVCRCTSDGHHAACTLKRCPSKNDIKKTDESTKF